jgi:APA family basic amino acid/polyamine antiporter
MISIINIGALAGLTSVLIVNLLGQPRILYSMSRDGLLPPIFATIHPKYKTPYITTLFTGILCAIMAALFPIDILGELTSVGTLFAFFLVCLSVPILRHKKPNYPRQFMVPFGPYLIPVAGAVSSLGLVFTSTVHTIIRLIVWMVIGSVIYFAYGFRHSRVRACRRLFNSYIYIYI